MRLGDGRRRFRFRRVLTQRRDDDRLEVGPGPQRRGRGRQAIERQQHPDARVAHEVLDFRRGVGWIDVDDDGAQPQHGEHADQVLRAIRQHDADAIALDDAMTRQGGGKPVDLVLELAEREIGAQKCRRGKVAAFSRGAPKNFVQRPLRVGRMVRDPVVVVVQPRTLLPAASAIALRNRPSAIDDDVCPVM